MEVCSTNAYIVPGVENYLLAHLVRCLVVSSESASSLESAIVRTIYESKDVQSKLCKNVCLVTDMSPEVQGLVSEVHRLLNHSLEFSGFSQRARVHIQDR